jgi:CheY-like chemotaxis protein
MTEATGRHALIIEDEMLIALEVESLLGDLGYQTFDIADSPGQALGCAKARRPDLITADLRIIGGTGTQAVRDIVAALGPSPVVYVTGNGALLQGEKSSPVVDKPIAARALAAACARACAAA